ncbi:HNH endonuclease [Halorubellus salinus]|uniref:HNH endonuclease n=1 Tax=Halorubellus salinus TaxID=755309 RepID=UPI001D079986|nr:HNH endonuclease [Halorubellus salinus]
MSNLLWKSLVRGAYKAAGLDSPYAQTEYGVNWSKQRRKCLERDDHTCRVCGTSADDLGRELSVHHITPRSEFDGTPRRMNALDNLVSLCLSCHGTFENRFTDCSSEEFSRRAREHLD